MTGEVPQKWIHPKIQHVGHFRLRLSVRLSSEGDVTLTFLLGNGLLPSLVGRLVLTPFLNELQKNME